ncbi:MAG: phage tail protein [Lachnospiraceae bacterium]|nr:phage tail protein [Lachnospiraceae bacterium]
MPDQTIYSIRKNRFQSGLHPGFVLEQNGCLRADESLASHCIYLKAIDSGRMDSEWGRLTLDISHTEDMICYVRVAAMDQDSFYRNERPVRIEDFLCNPEETDSIKKVFFERIQALRFVNQEDMLLYSLKGRYLYLMVEVIGEGSCEIDGMRIDMRGDNFMNTFPSVYRERDSFFHRWMSIFSSMYNDFGGEIERLPSLLDLDTCPAELLSVYAGWLGINVGNDFLDEAILRPLVKEAYALNRMKGTRAALERVAEIVLGEKVLVLERNVMANYIEPEQMAEFERLYGDSVYDVTILVRNPLNELTKTRLLFLLNQFSPVRSRLHIIHAQQEGVLDDYAYLDMDARIAGQKQGALDESQVLDGIVRLEE